MGSISIVDPGASWRVNFAAASGNGRRERVPAAIRRLGGAAAPHGESRSSHVATVMAPCAAAALLVPLATESTVVTSCFSFLAADLVEFYEDGG